METHLERQLGMILRFLSFKSTIINEMFLKGGLVMLIKMWKFFDKTKELKVKTPERKLQLVWDGIKYESLQKK